MTRAAAAGSNYSQDVISLSDVEAAARTIAGQVLRTPCTPSKVLSKLTGAEVWIKFENFQFTASFKERGALNKLASLTGAECAAGVAAMSAGNHAQAVAYHATRLGIKSCIVMPKNTPFTKVRNTRELGGEVILHGETLAESFDFMQRELVEGRGMTLVHPYDDPLVMAGQGTIALEMLAEVPELDTLVIPIGGGGLFSGNAVAAHSLRPDMRVVGVESAGYCSRLCGDQAGRQPRARRSDHCGRHRGKRYRQKHLADHPRPRARTGAR